MRRFLCSSCSNSLWFNKDAESIAKTMVSKKVSPKGLGSAIRMMQIFINRGGKGLSTSRKRELEKAKKILQGMREKKGRVDVGCVKSAQTHRLAGCQCVRAGLGAAYLFARNATSAKSRKTSQ